MSGKGRSSKVSTQTRLNYATSGHEEPEKADMAAVHAELMIPLQEMMVAELEKSRKSLSEEFKALLAAATASINSSVVTLSNTVAAHEATIVEIEGVLTTHSDEISTLQRDVASLTSQLASVTKEKTVLQDTVEDLISRSKRQNLRIVGLPEDAEGGDPRQFMADLFAEVTEGLLGNSPPELDRAHRSLRTKPGKDAPPRPVIVRFHRYVDKERVLRWAKEHRDVSFQGHRIKFYEDFSASIAKKRAAFNGIKSKLFKKKGVRFGLVYPARLRVSFGGVERWFGSPEEAERYFLEFIEKA